MFQTRFDTWKDVIEKFICFITNHDFYVAALGMHHKLFIIIFRNHILDFLCIRFFEIVYDIFSVWSLLKCSSSDSVYFCHHYFLIQYMYYSNHYLLLLVLNNLLLFLDAQKGSQYLKFLCLCLILFLL